MAAIFGFRSKVFWLFLIHKSPRYVLPSFESFGVSGQKKIEIYFQDGYYVAHLEVPIGAILAIFDLHVTRILPAKFRVNRPSVQEKKFQINFQNVGRCSYLWFPITTI